VRATLRAARGRGGGGVERQAGRVWRGSGSPEGVESVLRVCRECVESVLRHYATPRRRATHTVEEGEP